MKRKAKTPQPNRMIHNTPLEPNAYDPSQWQRQGFCFYCLMPIEIRFAGKEVRHAHNFTPYSRCAEARTKRDDPG